MWRWGCPFLDSVCRPEPVTRNRNGQIRTKSRRTFACADGYGSAVSRVSQGLRICRYTDDLKNLLATLQQANDVMRRISEMDFKGMPVSLTEAVELEHLLTTYSQRRDTVVERPTTKTVRNMPRRANLRPVTCWFYNDPELHPGVLATLIQKKDVVRLMQTEDGFWFDCSTPGKMVSIGIPGKFQTAIERGVSCGRVVKSTSICNDV